MANLEMAAYLVALVAAREVEVKAGSHGHDSVSRLVVLSQSKAVDFVQCVVENVGGLLIGAVETTSHAVVNALEYLLKKPDGWPRHGCRANRGRVSGRWLCV
jgi:cytochrome P450